MRERADAQLDRIDKLKPGQGSVDAFLFGEGDLDGGKLGAALEYEHRLNEAFSAFGKGSLGYHYGNRPGIPDSSRLGWDVLAGVRGRF